MPAPVRITRKPAKGSLQRSNLMIQSGNNSATDRLAHVILYSLRGARPFTGNSAADCSSRDRNDRWRTPDGRSRAHDRENRNQAELADLRRKPQAAPATR